MKRYILYIFAIAYLFNIFQHAYEWLHTLIILRKLKRFIIAYKQKGAAFFSNPNVYKQQLNSLLRYSSAINKHDGYHSFLLSRKNQDYVNYDNAQKYYAIFLDVKDSKEYELMCSLNPINAVKILFSFPTTFLVRIGFRPRKANELITNIIGAIIECAILSLLEIYSTEIKEYIKIILDTLCNTP